MYTSLWHKVVIREGVIRIAVAGNKDEIDALIFPLEE